VNKKLFMVSLIPLLLIPLVMAPTPVAISAESKIHAIAVLGKGIAALQDDPMDFMIVKFGLAKAKIVNETKSIGVLKLDDERYVLRNIVIEEGHATGDIYRNNSQVGSFDVSSVMKGDTEIWAGTMELDDQDYNLYVIEGVRPIKASELKEKVVEYCNTTEDANCRERLSNYCQNNPDDARCRALFRAWCLKSDNMDDTRCRYEFRNWCKNNSTNKYCVPFELQRSKSYCEEHSDSVLCQRIANFTANFCQNNSDNEGCITVKNLIEQKPKLLEKVQALRSRITRLRVNASTSVSSATSADVGG
jgi:hypothetical protein